ncbi:MAG TPA: hypothetical protein VK818_09670 [Methylomirabilota bacterium]|nr:hypothetical protein [Methylomirabilota bacterium]
MKIPRLKWPLLITCLPIIVASAFAVAPISPAQTGSALQRLDDEFFQELRWRSIGPHRGGRSLAVTGVPGQPEVFYFGSVDGGVWRTNDAGRTWNPIFDSQPIGSIGAIAVAPSNPDVIYVGSGEADMRSNIGYGNGMYKSTDAGKSWTHIGLTDSRQIARILVDPADPNRVFVAALGHAYGPNTERGVFRSKDGGATWQRILFHDENTGPIDLAFEPGNSGTIYAALLQTRRPPWNVYPPSKGPGSGLYRSRDRGDHWEPVTGHGLPAEEVGRIGITFAPSNPKRIYLIVDAKAGGLYRSDDSGQNWQLISQDKRIRERGWYFGEVSVDPKDADTVYLPNTTVYRSRDGGKTFAAFKGAPGGDDYHQMWIDPDEPRRMILGSDQGTIVTRNGGETWSSWYNQPTGQMYHVSTDNRFPYWVYGAQQDSGSIATPSRGNYRALDFHDWRPIAAGDENGYIAPDPENPGVIYGGFVTRQDLNDEQIQQTPPTLAHPGNYRRTWTLPLVFSPIDPHVLYFGSQVLFRTADGGNSWQVISPDLTREDPGAPPNLDPPTIADAGKEKSRGVIYTIGPSYQRKGEIWAGTDDGLIQLTQDEGKTWSNVTPPEITPWSKVTHIEASHSDAGTAYAAVDRHRLDDLRPYLYRTRNFGKHWELISNGIPEGYFLNCVREDPVRKGLLYACTEKGVFVSFDDGDHWQALQMNLPSTSVRDLVIHGDDLVIATHGRSFWILDDIAPLRQITAEMAQSASWLFQPSTAYRVRPGTDQGTPVPFDEPHADNPPDGAVLDYYLKDTQSTAVQLEIFDSAGVLVRRYASGDVLPKTKPEDMQFPMYWVHDPEPLSATTGAHRFVWDLHYAFPADVHSSFYGPTAPLALPGKYTVKLTVNGQSHSQPLELKMDPRVKTSQADLEKMFRAESRVAKNLADLSTAMKHAQELQANLATRKKEMPSSGEAAEALAALDRKTAELMGLQGEPEFGVFGLTVPATDTVTLREASHAARGLLSIVQTADAAPTTDAALAIEKWDSATKNILERWDALWQHDRTRVNSLLQKANLKPL